MASKLKVKMYRTSTRGDGLHGSVVLKLGKGLEIRVGTSIDRASKYRTAAQLKAALQQAGWDAGHALLAAFAEGGAARKAVRAARPA